MLNTRTSTSFMSSSVPWEITYAHQDEWILLSKKKNHRRTFHQLFWWEGAAFLPSGRRKSIWKVVKGQGWNFKFCAYRQSMNSFQFWENYHPSISMRIAERHLDECSLQRPKTGKQKKLENQITPYKEREERNHRGGKHTYRVNTQSRTFSPMCRKQISVSG